MAFASSSGIKITGVIEQLNDRGSPGYHNHHQLGSEWKQEGTQSLDIDETGTLKVPTDEFRCAILSPYPSLQNNHDFLSWHTA